ncbi:MAG: methyltransferase, partial [Alphaproteobacteria bacterium]
MQPPNLSRLHRLRIENEEAAAEQAQHADRFNRIRNRHDNGTAPRAVSAWQLFQTPPDLAAKAVALASPAPGLTWLEPSAGLGRIARVMLETSPKAVTVCEKSADLAAELYRLKPRVTIWQGDFLEREPVAMFDRVVMNPPFHMRADIRHISHAMRFVKPGGVLVAICMNTRHRVEALEPEANYWEELPAGTFKGEGTKVAT